MIKFIWACNNAFSIGFNRFRRKIVDVLLSKSNIFLMIDTLLVDAWLIAIHLRYKIPNIISAKWVIQIL